MRYNEAHPGPKSQPGTLRMTPRSALETDLGTPAPGAERVRWGWVGRSVRWFVPQSVAESADGPRTQMAVAIALFMVVVFVVLAAAHAVALSHREAIANLGLAGLMLAGPLVMRATGRYKLVVNAVIAAAFGVVLFIGGAERGAGVNAGTIALAEIPLFATLLLGWRVGAIWAALACAASVTLGFAGHFGIVDAGTRTGRELFDDHVVLVIVTATLFLVAAMYEWGRARGLERVAALDAQRGQSELEKLEAQAEARVARAERMASLGRIAAATAHEINNPLSYVAANLEFLGRATDESAEERSAAIAESLDGVRRIQRIVTDLKLYARPGDDPLSLVDVRTALETAVKMSKGHLRATSRLDIRLDPVPPVLASESRLVQVFLNLLVNAAQALSESGAREQRISLRTFISGSQIEVQIEDTGTGMPDDVARRAGEPFFTTKPDGTGLGLAVCQSILAQIGGELHLESTPEGTIARVALQAAAESASLAQERPTEAARELSIPSSRVLVVDDEPLVARAIRRCLSNHDVQIVGSGREALTLLGNGERFDLVLCDMMMPELSGMDVYAEIQKQHPELLGRLVFMTGATFTDRASEFRAAVQNPVLEKPLQTDKLLALLANCRRGNAVGVGHDQLLGGELDGAPSA